MRILFDHGTPAPLQSFLKMHTVSEAKDMGWDRLSNGELLRAAEDASFDLLLTTDKNIAYQQNLKGRKIAILVLGNGQWPKTRQHVEKIIEAVNAATTGSYTLVEIP
jgi:predicted nuclease of predicted toxin-antitoxin system